MVPTISQKAKSNRLILDDLSQRIIDIGLKCKSYEVCNIAISSIMVRSSIRLNQVISKVNNTLKVLYATNGFNFLCNDEIGKEMVWKDRLYLTNDGAAMLADNFTEYLNINMGIDFNPNSNFNKDFLDWQLSRAKSSDIKRCIKDVGHKSQSKQSKNDLCAGSGILADSFSKIKKARIENINSVIIGNLNINSFPNKFEELKVLVNGMLDILIITETKLDDTWIF